MALLTPEMPLLAVVSSRRMAASCAALASVETRELVELELPPATLHTQHHSRCQRCRKKDRRMIRI